MRTVRRRLLQAVPVLAAVATAAAARAATTDLVVACDTPLARPLRAVAEAFAARSGVRVHVFRTPPGLILPQLERAVQNDIVICTLDRLSRAVEGGIVAVDAPRAGSWRNRLVLVARRETPVAAVDAGPVAVTDVSAATEFDGVAALATAGLFPQRIIGAIDTDEVLFLLATGGAASGLLHTSDLSPELQVVRPLDDAAYPPLVYAAAVTKLARRPNPDAFIRFLAGDEATALLRAHGLEKWS